MCDKKGWFSCEGPFDSKNCDKLHTINPYASRGYRQLFGLWNLDHM
jgi:DNA fragmentation factor beta subunit